MELFLPQCTSSLLYVVSNSKRKNRPAQAWLGKHWRTSPTRHGAPVGAAGQNQPCCANGCFIASKSHDVSGTQGVWCSLTKQNLLPIFLASADGILPNADLPGFNTQHNYRCGRVSGGGLTKQRRADILAFRKKTAAWSLRSHRRQILLSAHSLLLLRLKRFIGSMPRCSGPITTPL